MTFINTSSKHLFSLPPKNLNLMRYWVLIMSKPTQQTPSLSYTTKFHENFDALEDVAVARSVSCVLKRLCALKDKQTMVQCTQRPWKKGKLNELTSSFLFAQKQICTQIVSYASHVSSLCPNCVIVSCPQNGCCVAANHLGDLFF